MVPDSAITAIVEAGRYAPSGGNSQTTHFIVIKKRDVLDKLAVMAQEEFAKMEVNENTYKGTVLMTKEPSLLYTLHK